ncbi:thiol-disulfide oxidoreductase DCC family protein [Phormidesmis priestleyi]|uniref:thiol-disulfide oxidoreductase DCC family protein n=1 Tax=Phormidesmis priestleyi TaxID=268141 RepID=UPI00083AC4C4|nr:DCC1-like thiol-disulfide oxidoreductase family protein [Phormidesmis priestleyi]
MTYAVIYDGQCNLCSNLVQLLETLDKGDRFQYLPMQDQAGLDRYSITAQDCEMGMILIDNDHLDHRWQGSSAAEAIGRILPFGGVFVTAYQSLPGVKWMGDRVYEQVRDNRYALFGRRPSTYQTAYPVCDTACEKHFSK